MDQTTAAGIVEARLIAAVQTLRAIPSAEADIQIDPTRLPAYVADTLQAAFQDQTARRIAPTEADLADMREAIKWLGFIDPLEGELVWLRADGQPWRYVSQKTGCVRPKAWRRWTAAIAKIARRAKLKTPAKPGKARATTTPKAGADQGQGQGMGGNGQGEGTGGLPGLGIPPDLRTPILQGGAGATGGV